MDGDFFIGAGNDGLFRKVCQILDKPEWIQDPKFQTNADRVQFRDELVAMMSQILNQKPTHYWLSAFQHSGVPFAPINNIQQTLAHPQVIHRKMIQTIDHPKLGKIQVIGSRNHFFL